MNFVLNLATSSMGLSVGNFKLINMKYFDAETDVHFHLYTLKNPTTPQLLSMNNTKSFDVSNFNYDVPTRILIHGFQSNGELRRVLTEGKCNENASKFCNNKHKYLIIFFSIFHKRK